LYLTIKMAKQAPENFGVLQLVTSNDYDVAHLWKQYLKNPGNPNSIWKLRVEEDHWCAGAYLVRLCVDTSCLCQRVFSKKLVGILDIVVCMRT
jgi:hypothetical protein